MDNQAEALDDEQVLAILKTDSRVALFRDIRDFFSDRLIIRAHAGVSIFVHHSEFVPVPQYYGSTVFLGNVGDRTAGLCHELLHLKMTADGFPFVAGGANMGKWRAWQRRLNALECMICNSLDHVWMLPRFLALGMSPEAFLLPRAVSDPDPNSTDHILASCFAEDADLGRFAFGARYLCDAITDRLGIDGAMSKETIRVGLRYYAGANADAELINDFVDDQSYCRREDRKDAVGSLFALFHLPQPAFFWLDRVDGQMRVHQAFG